MTDEKKSIRALAEELKEIRRRAVPKEKIERFNKIINGETPSKRHKNKQPDPSLKIARPPETKV